MEATIKQLLENIIMKTPGELIDSLITTDLKIFYFIEIETDESKTVQERFEAGQSVLKLNKKRNELMAAINVTLGRADESIKTF